MTALSSLHIARRTTLRLAFLLAVLGLRPDATARASARDPSAPRLVRVALSTSLTAQALAQAGIDVIEAHPGRFAMVLEWPGDDARLARLGAPREVIDEDPGVTAARRAHEDLPRRESARGKIIQSAARPDGITRVETLPPFGSGSLAGYWTLEEVKMKLDDLVASDTHDVVADKIDTLGYSVQGRPIWGLRIARSMPAPDSRPTVYYGALTHAREPGGMQALLYFVDDILSKYGTDPTATYLLDHRILYIVPVVNPDGYKINEDYYFSTGGVAFGYHRKNARDTNGNGMVDIGSDGIDINRNYGFQWGLNDVGSSPNPADETYRGPAPFSEPETQVQRDVVAALRPTCGISFHTYGDLMIHPWGYTPQATPDSLRFYEWDDEITLGNGYHSGQGVRVLYEVNGEFTDWCYGEATLKPRMFAWTPELGGPSDGFWAFASRIQPIAAENLRACYWVASLAGPVVRVERSTLAEGALHRGGIAHLTLRARNKGLAPTPGPELSATLVSLSTGGHVIQAVGGAPAIGSFQSVDQPYSRCFTISADDTVTLGRRLRFQVNFSDVDGFFSRDTVEFYCGTPTVLLADDAESGMGNWTTGNNQWGNQTGDPYRPGSFFSDSPSGLYPSNSNRSLTTASSFNLTTGVRAYLDFLARWEFEGDYDCGVVEGNLSGNTWTPAPGRATTPGNTGAQPPGQPVFEGAGRMWRPERVDLPERRQRQLRRLPHRLRAHRHLQSRESAGAGRGGRASHELDARAVGALAESRAGRRAARVLAPARDDPAAGCARRLRPPREDARGRRVRRGSLPGLVGSPRRAGPARGPGALSAATRRRRRLGDPPLAGAVAR
ncbi:MAG: zinc carboxypeptidase [Candidatus Eisenbacteria bacterium]|uniref:Zinc carboxypeptidase n=1 Tax=Eiseniibacteriota bacterium TaxID=2212470 RepID=A0A538UA07_UNCEI|nr:MAG: zinc carboxypeptidase [Candidatus Eisenbacteria bacterium]